MRPGQRILVLGRGQLGSEFPKLVECAVLEHKEADVTSRPQLEEAIGRVRPDVLVSTAAFHRVDQCEEEPTPAFLVNALGSLNLAVACREYGVTLVWFSTDYVFDGRQRRPYTEGARVAPLNAYGASKAAGEMLIRAYHKKHLIVRTSSLFGVAGSSGKGGNFVETILKKASEGGPLEVAADITMSPTYTRDLAQAVLRLIDAGARGTVHATNSGECSWWEFAGEICRQAGYRVTVNQRYGTVGAVRPAYSVLDTRRLRRWGLGPLRHWKEALGAYLEERAALRPTDLGKVLAKDRPPAGV